MNMELTLKIVFAGSLAIPLNRVVRAVARFLVHIYWTYTL